MQIGRQRIALIAGALVTTFVLPIVFLQKWGEKNPYILTVLGLVAVLLYFGYLITSPWFVRLTRKHIGERPIMALLAFLVTGAVLGTGLGLAAWFAVRANKQHLAEIAAAEAKPASAEQIAEAVANKWSAGLPPPNSEVCRRTRELTRRMRQMAERHQAESDQLSNRQRNEAWAVPDPAAEPRDQSRERWLRHNDESSRLTTAHYADFRNGDIAPEASYLTGEMRRRLADEPVPKLEIDLILRGEFVTGHNLMGAADYLDRLAKRLCP